jgi:TolA-binding protein
LIKQVLILSAIALGGIARADTLWIGSAGTNPLKFDRVKITKIEGNQIFYQGSDGRDSTKELDRVQKLAVDDDPALTAAENAFAASKFDEAVDNYAKAARSTNKQWVKDWASNRLKDAAVKSGRFDAVADAQIQLILKDPRAAKNKLQMPAANSTYLDTAIGNVTTALQQAGLSDVQKIGLLTFQSDLYRAKKDEASADKAAAQIDELLAKNPNDPAAAGAVVRRKLQNAAKAIEAKDYQKAIGEITSAKSQITDPAQQADALYYLAEAQFGIASGSKDANALKDAGIAYMRVVAHFKDQPGKPHVAESLVKTGNVYEALGDTKTAEQVYEQVAAQYKDDPAAKVAQENLQRLKSR